ncbi:uncharacterized protein CANTADRAFT_98601 [Suhomyces tanzawaensis NRRL Y-17324]|uniref:25S rRNA (Uridine(2843)-N(3))-methyltransferase n=1 Tax=Suhomyces tanzawaensis NRRL Y-17324 TaxID=984487 RepID=A0A1E4SRR8_9ASCO|nr:uncharacterized protein CANTADRAFT_98601 [Suhomyces tanzawaensis NRRL Y-17324]ODV82209.1 hypothetical protein CANTADRAFT_98601 [Suhomyces tanzawaensis NRRL Y-17324]
MGRKNTSQADDGELSNTSIPFDSEYSLGHEKLIDMFTQTLGSILNSEDLNQHIQSVKSCLYDRNYIEAFDSDDKRFAYVSRWTPARALAYTSLFASLDGIKELFEDKDKQTEVLCIGGGASSELVGLASVFCRQKEYNSTSDSSLKMNIIDIADWSKVVNSLTNYAQKNWMYDGSKLQANFIHEDVLNQPKIDYGAQSLITLLFTTNELFAEKRKETMALLNTFNAKCTKGTLLLIAESAGSYSHITIGTRKFPVQFLIDMTLIGKQGENNGPWELIDESDSCWYRIETKKIDYPMKLENMRFFYRLYRKK